MAELSCINLRKIDTLFHNNMFITILESNDVEGGPNCCMYWFRNVLKVITRRRHCGCVSHFLKCPYK